jgi:enamine deaminase RidA (YjgF/YER057c/UK114 family)
MSGRVQERLTERGIELPRVQPPVANYMPAVAAGNLLHVAGQVSVWNGEFRHVGQLGREIDVEEGRQAARLCGLNILAQMQAVLGDLDRVRRCVKLNVFVNSAAGFIDQPKVANGASDLMVEAFGDAGRHACSAVGIAQLPFGVSVEIDALSRLAPSEVSAVP